MSNAEQPISSDVDAPRPLTIEEARQRATYLITHRYVEDKNISELAERIMRASEFRKQ
jgi:hypothetical protein